MINKLISMIIIFALSLSLCACGNNKSAEDNVSVTSEAAVEETTVEETTEKAKGLNSDEPILGEWKFNGMRINGEDISEETLRKNNSPSPMFLVSEDSYTLYFLHDVYEGQCAVMVNNRTEFERGYTLNEDDPLISAYIEDENTMHIAMMTKDSDIIIIMFTRK